MVGGKTMRKYTNEELLDILGSYRRMIQINGEKYPTVVLDDIEKSITFVLKTNGYNGRYMEEKINE
jgi:hypothetical protein